LQVKAQAALILAIVEREIGDLETVALEDEKKDERDGYKAEARCDITRADDQTDHRDEPQGGGGGDAGDKPVAPDDGAGADEPPRAISGWFAARSCNSWDGRAQSSRV
jgi:hypothetical protein